MMKRVTGIGGVFFKCEDPERMRNWYKEHLGLNTDEYGTVFVAGGKNSSEEFTTWSPFPKDTDYFSPSSKDFMINFCVDDLEKLIPVLASEGVEIIDELEVFEYGKFIHILDPEKNKIELWNR